MKLTNKEKIGLSMAVFLAGDTYDYDPRDNSLSATGLLKSTRQTVLSQRAAKLNADTDVETDISSMVASTFGTAIHDGVEAAWTNGRYKKAMKRLGISDDIITRIHVNPTPEVLKAFPDTIPVYMEQRAEKKVAGYVVTGKFDFVANGQLEDHKTTGTYTFMKKTNDYKYKIQGSIYRWLNPDIITNDVMLINYVFTDFSALRADIEAAKGYPPRRMMSVPITLMSIEETQKFIENKLGTIKANIHLDESKLPQCTKDELWQDPTNYKYYKNPALKTRSTKNFTSFAEAQMRLVKDGSVGQIDIVPGMAKYCNYCPAAGICSQAKQLVADGLLKLEN
jgi:hypothetical protein